MIQANNLGIFDNYVYVAFIQEFIERVAFWPRGLADPVLGKAYLLLLLFFLLLFLENFFAFHENSEPISVIIRI